MKRNFAILLFIWLVFIHPGFAEEADSNYPPKDMPKGTYASPNVMQPATSATMDNGCGDPGEAQESAAGSTPEADNQQSSSTPKVIARIPVQPRLKVAPRDCIRPRP